MTPRPVSVDRQPDGSWRCSSDPSWAAPAFAMLERAHAQWVHLGHLPVAEVRPLIAAWRDALARNRLVPGGEPIVAAVADMAAAFVSSAQAAERLGISERAVRKRIKAGKLSAHLVGGRYLVDVKELDRAA